MAINFEPVTGIWDKPVYLIGGGDSLTGFDFDRIKGLGITVGVNRAAWLLNTDVMFTLDQTLVMKARQEIIDYIKSGGEAYLCMPTNDSLKPIEGAHYIIRDRGAGLHHDKTRINGLNSGYGALGLAYHKGAKEIALLGYDMAQGKKTHWHGGYPWHNPQNHKYYQNWATNFERAANQLNAAGANVVNFVGEPQSRIPYFTKRPLSDL